MSADDDGFFARWSRRKAQARGEPVVPAASPPLAPSPDPVELSASVPARVSAPSEDHEQTPAPVPPPPTLEDVQSLTPASDFSRFVARDVAPEVRNAAVKKLFADPHFNVMDGLDIYIDDYTKAEPIPVAMMAKMVSAQFLKLVDDPEQPRVAQAPPAAAVPTEAEADDQLPAANDSSRASDAASGPEETHDDHPDLQLQPDHAPGPQGPGTGAG